MCEAGRGVKDGEAKREGLHIRFQKLRYGRCIRLWGARIQIHCRVRGKLGAVFDSACLYLVPGIGSASVFGSRRCLIRFQHASE